MALTSHLNQEQRRSDEVVLSSSSTVDAAMLRWPGRACCFPPSKHKTMINNDGKSGLYSYNLFLAVCTSPWVCFFKRDGVVCDCSTIWHTFPMQYNYSISNINLIIWCEHFPAGFPAEVHKIMARNWDLKRLEQKNTTNVWKSHIWPSSRDMSTWWYLLSCAWNPRLEKRSFICSFIRKKPKWCFSVSRKNQESLKNPIIHCWMFEIYWLICLLKEVFIALFYLLFAYRLRNGGKKVKREGER